LWDLYAKISRRLQVPMNFYPSVCEGVTVDAGFVLLTQISLKNHTVLGDLDIALSFYQDFATLSLPVTPPSDMPLFEATSKHSVDQDISSPIRTYHVRTVGI
jgi:hypothetical protein